MRGRLAGDRYRGDKYWLARQCRLIIIAVRPQEIMAVFREIAPVMDGSEHIVSLAAGVGLADLESVFWGSVTRTVPTITSRAWQGTTLICHGHRVGAGDAIRVEELLSSIGDVMLVGEDELAVATLLSAAGRGCLLPSSRRWPRRHPAQVTSHATGLFRLRRGWPWPRLPA
ncbi:MAG: hypothetical protein RQM90_11905 [Methanoculleus sp.]